MYERLKVLSVTVERWPWQSSFAATVFSGMGIVCGLVRVHTDRGDVTLALSEWTETDAAAIKVRLERCAQYFAVNEEGQLFYTDTPGELLDRIAATNRKDQAWPPGA